MPRQFNAVGFHFDDDNFPIVYKDATKEVYINPSGEVFIQRLGPYVKEPLVLRITPRAGNGFDVSGGQIDNDVVRLSPRR